MVTPRTPSGGPHICFNPYLEWDLGPTAPFTVGTQTYPADPMAGTRSNCMHCHARAGWPAYVPGNPHSANLGRIFNEGYMAPDDPYYARITKTDFLWSLVFTVSLRRSRDAAGHRDRLRRSCVSASRTDTLSAEE